MKTVTGTKGTTHATIKSQFFTKALILEQQEAYFRRITLVSGKNHLQGKGDGLQPVVDG